MPGKRAPTHVKMPVSYLRKLTQDLFDASKQLAKSDLSAEQRALLSKWVGALALTIDSTMKEMLEQQS
jgi:hypothetical protein